MKKVLLSLPIALCLILWAGCDSLNTEPSSDDAEGHLRVLLTDAPGDILEANVTIEKVTLVPSEEATDTTASARDEGAGVITLLDSTFTVDLVQLQDGVTATLADIPLPEGSYSQIRFVTAREASVFYEDENGQRAEAELMLPSADETGIKINFDAFEVKADQDDVEIVLDFNVEKSFVKAGRSGTYIFKPVVQAQSLVVNGDSTNTGSN